MLSCFGMKLKLVMMHRWDPETALRLIEAEQVTAFVGVPTQSWDLLESPAFAKYDTSSLATIGGGGAPAPVKLVDRVEKGFARGRPNIGYGMTETNAFGPGNNGDDYVTHPTSTGRARTTIIDVEIRDEDGSPLPVGQAGRDLDEGPQPHPRATGTSPRRRPRPSSTAGWPRATWAGSTRTGSSTSRTGPRTWCSGPGRTSTAPRWRAPSTSTRPSTRPPCSASPTSAWARRWPASIQLKGGVDPRPPTSSGTSWPRQLAAVQGPEPDRLHRRPAAPQPVGQDPRSASCATTFFGARAA